MHAQEILIGCFVECQSIKTVGGRRSVEELYQALFFVSLFPPECFTERNENRACMVAGSVFRNTCTNREVLIKRPLHISGSGCQWLTNEIYIYSIISKFDR